MEGERQAWGRLGCARAVGVHSSCVQRTYQYVVHALIAFWWEAFSSVAAVIWQNWVQQRSLVRGMMCCFPLALLYHRGRGGYVTTLTATAPHSADMNRATSTIYPLFTTCV